MAADDHRRDRRPLRSGIDGIVADEEHLRGKPALLRGAALEIQDAGEPVTVEPGRSVTRPVTMPPAGQRPAGRDPARRGKIPAPV